MSGPDALTRDDDIDMAGMVAALKRRWWVILLVAAVTGGGLFYILSSMDERFLSATRILVKDGNNAFTRTTAESNQLPRTNAVDQQAVRSEVEIVQSDLIALQVIDQLNLVEKAEFIEGADSGLFRSLFLGRKKSVEADRNEVLNVFRERLSVFSIEQSRVIVVEFWSHNPRLTQKIVTAVAEKYSEFKLRESAQSQENATTWLDPRITELENAVNQKEAAVASYRASEDLLRVDNSNALLATQQLSQISTELSRLKAERSSAQARASSISSALKVGVPIDVIPEVLDSNLIQRLREREVDLESQVSDLSVTLLPGHPRLKSLNSQLKKLKDQIRSAANDVVTSLERNVAATRDAEADLAKEIIRLKTEAARVDEKLVELRAREREAQTARELLAEYKSRSLEAKSRAGLAQSNVEIISPASFPIDSYFPKVIPFTIAGTAAATLLSFLFVVASSLLTTANTRESAKDEAKPKPPSEKSADATKELHQVMGLEPKMKGSGNKQPPIQPPGFLTGRSGALPVSSDIQPGQEVLAVRHAATALLKLGRSRVAIMSPGGQPGSKTAWVLARHLAGKNKKVVVIDFATGATSTTEMLGKPNSPGFFNALSGSVRIDKAMYKDRMSRARIVPGGSLFPGHPTPQPQAVSDLVDAYAGSFDYCILDCGNVEIEDLNVIADDDTVAIVSTIKADPADYLEVVDNLEMDGFTDVLQLLPDREDLKPGQIQAAA